MAQPTDQNKTKDQQAPTEGAEAAENEEQISLDQLDDIILKEDPSFAEDLKRVQALPSDPSIDLEIEINGNYPSPKENPWLDETSTVHRALAKIFPFLPALWVLKFRIVHGARSFRIQARTFLIDAGPMLLKASKNAATASKAYAKERATTFKGLKWSMKLVAIGLTLGVVGTTAFVYRSLTHGVIPPEKELLTASLEEWAGQSYKYDAETEMDSFYDSPRTIQNIMTLPKMIVNLQPSTHSGPNPMAAMEFFLEGLSPEAIVEVKDREPEIRDLFQRTAEGMTFDELDTAEGKQQLTERLRQALNNSLTKGKIRRVFIKEAVIKP
jgi:flagellar basal body-associated protein FliL